MPQDEDMARSRVEPSSALALPTRFVMCDGEQIEKTQILEFILSKPNVDEARKALKICAAQLIASITGKKCFTTQQLENLEYL